MITVVTISRQLGSQGYQVGRAVAERMGFQLLCREVINQAARQAGSPVMALAAIDELGLLKLCPSKKDCLAYRQAVEDVILKAAHHGSVVIVGRAAQVILRNQPNVLHVRVVAPEPVRASRLAQQHQVSLDAAYAQLQKSDRYRRSYLKRFYQVHWDDPDLYDLVMNTERLTPVMTASLICCALPDSTNFERTEISFDSSG